MRWLWNLVLLLIFVTLVLFSAIAYFDNTQSVALHFLEWYTPAYSIYWWLLAALTLGFICGSLIIYIGSVSLRMSERKSRRELLKLKQELQVFKDARREIPAETA